MGTKKVKIYDTIFRAIITEKWQIVAALLTMGVASCAG